MAILTDPITADNVVSRFYDYVHIRATTGIVWGTNAYPFPEFSTVAASYLGGTTGGYLPNVAGSSITPVNEKVTASNIFDVLVADAATYTNIRNMRAILFVEGDGGNTGTRPTAGVVYDQTSVAFMTVAYRQSIGTINPSDVSATSTVTSNGLEGFFQNMANAYDAARGTAATVQVNVCHASCHSSCHGSRGRR